jgi:hypothetical protein
VNLQITGLTQVGANSAGVCPGSSGAAGTLATTSLGNHAFVQSEFIPARTVPVTGGGEVDLAPKIVALGWDEPSSSLAGGSSPSSSASGNVYSREEAILDPVTPLPVVGANNTMTLSGVSALGLSLTTVISGNLQAVTSMSLSLVTLGANLSLSNGLLDTFECGCSRPSGLPVANFVGNMTLAYRQPVTVSSTKSSCPSTNSTCSGINGYSSTTDSVNTSGTVTLAAGDYVFCDFHAGGVVTTNGTANGPVRIFIDSPSSSRCKGNSPTLTQTLSAFGSQKFWTEGNFYAAKGINNAGVSGVVAPSGLQIYVVGDGSYDDNTFVQIGTPPSGGLLSGNQATQEAIVYAPTSDVLMNTDTCVSFLVCTGGTFIGNLIGNDVTASAATFTQDLDLANDPLYNGVNAYHIQQYVQCSSLPVDSSGKTYTSLQQDPAIDTRGC